MKFAMFASLICVSVMFAGCDRTEQQSVPTATSTKVPTFTLGWNEYPSSAMYAVAHDEGLINAEAGKVGSLEEKWGVDIVLTLKDYETLLQLYGTNNVDAIIVVAFDTFNLSEKRATANIMPVSQSVGGDACLVVGNISSLDDLKGKPTYGLEKTVQQYLFERYLEQNGKTLADYPFHNLDPAAGANAIQTDQPNVESVMLWNPLLMETARKRQNARVLFDSSSIPLEVVDVLVMGKDTLQKPGGEAFANALIDIYYEMNRRLNNPATRTDILTKLGQRFNNISANDMEACLKQTELFGTPEKAIEVYNSEQFRSNGVGKVVEFCVKNGIVEKQPTVGFDDEKASVNFTTKYIHEVQQAGK